MCILRECFYKLNSLDILKMCPHLYTGFSNYLLCTVMFHSCWFRYSMEDMYAVVSDVDDYKHFVPWCRDSVVFARKPGHLRAKLAVGFPPLVEKYNSAVTLVPPNLVQVLELDKRI